MAQIRPQGQRGGGDLLIVRRSFLTQFKTLLIIMDSVWDVTGNVVYLTRYKGIRHNSVPEIQQWFVPAINENLQ